jgi:hypothetical protein
VALRSPKSTLSGKGVWAVGGQATDPFGRCGQPDLAPNRRESVVGLSLPALFRPATSHILLSPTPSATLFILGLFAIWHSPILEETYIILPHIVLSVTSPPAALGRVWGFAALCNHPAASSTSETEKPLITGGSFLQGIYSLCILECTALKVPSNYPRGDITSPRDPNLEGS